MTGEQARRDTHTARVCIADSFWDHVDKSGSCWMWTRCTTSWGYGMYRVPPSNKSVMAHRRAYELTYGPIPAGLHVCHKCDTPGCVNPSHLFVGTASDNMRDAISKGRFKFPTPRVGVNNHKAKMTPAIVAELRRCAREDGMTVSAMARRFGIARATLRQAVSGRTWAHVPLAPSGYVPSQPSAVLPQSLDAYHDGRLF